MVACQGTLVDSLPTEYFQREISFDLNVIVVKIWSLKSEEDDSIFFYKRTLQQAHREALRLEICA